MIYRLQKRFILLSAASVFFVIVLIFFLIACLNISSMNKTLDTLADGVSSGNGNFPDSFDNRLPQRDNPKQEASFDFITPETRFSTRHFTVWFDEAGEVERTNTEFIYVIDDGTARVYAERAISRGDERGWISGYRYKVFSVGDGVGVVFIDGSTNRALLFQSLLSSAFVLLGCAVVVVLLIVILSKRVMKPVAESYEKQKQFVTDVNHELKTPLTLILTNLDIAEAELGRNEWLEDIRAEGQRMTELVNQLVALSRMDEEHTTAVMAELPLGEIVTDAVSEFKKTAQRKGKRLTVDIDEGIGFVGDAALLHRLVSVLMDNAIKYCDEDGEITVTFKRYRHVVLTVENSYRAVDSVELDRLFDRFYRADKARTYAGGFGVGLSIAKAIVRKHHGEITAYKKGGTHIGFRVVFKS